MSPEQARGEPVDARSDLFSLGTVLYTLATGRTPFRAESTYGILRRLTDESPRPLREVSPQFPAWFEMIVHKLLAKSSADRFASATEIAQLLEGCLAHVQQPGTVPLPKECEVFATRRALLRRGMLIVGACAAAGVFGTTFFHGTPSTEPQVSTKLQPAIAPASDLSRFVNKLGCRRRDGLATPQRFQ